MTWTKTITTVMVGGAIFVVAALATVVKLHSSVKDSYFDPDTDKLRLLPANLVVLRPTHFPQSPARTRHLHDGDSLTRTLGRDVPLRDAIAEAYDCNPARVVLPPGAPAGGYDFLVTTATDPREWLKTAIRKQLNYTAHEETRDADVFALRLVDPVHPGITPSGDTETPGVTVRNGRLYFQHEPLSAMLGGLPDGLNQLVVNQTGLTNFYNFSLPWNPDIEKAMNNGAFKLDGVQKVLGGWGMKLEPDTASMDMLIVQKGQK